MSGLNIPKETETYLLKKEDYEQLNKEERKTYLANGLENKLDTMSETDLRAFNEQYKQFHLPKHRLYAVLPYNIFVCAGAMYYTINIKNISKKYFKLQKFGFRELLYYGTIQSSFFVLTYTLGTMLVSGLWNPIQYGRDLAKINGKIIDVTVRHDQKAQKYFLYNFMEYFNLSQEVLDHAKQDLENQRKALDEKKYFTDETKKIIDEKEIDDEEELEDDEDQDNNNKESPVQNSFYFKIIQMLLPKN